MITWIKATIYIGITDIQALDYSKNFTKEELEHVVLHGKIGQGYRNSMSSSRENNRYSNTQSTFKY